jgi:hypothetical protein
MVSQEAFTREVSIDLMLSYFLVFGSLCVITVMVLLLVNIGLRIYRQVSAYRARLKTTRTDMIYDPSQDDNPVPPPPPPKEIIPTSKAFLTTMQKRANDPNVIAFNEEVQAICKTRKGDPSCEVDSGVGGGTAAAFDPTKDSYAKRPPPEESAEVIPAYRAPPQQAPSCKPK